MKIPRCKTFSFFKDNALLRVDSGGRLAQRLRCERFFVAGGEQIDSVEFRVLVILVTLPRAEQQAGEVTCRLDRVLLLRDGFWGQD